jgi:hypothetical protein
LLVKFSKSILGGFLGLRDLFVVVLLHFFDLLLVGLISLLKSLELIILNLFLLFVLLQAVEGRLKDEVGLGFLGSLLRLFFFEFFSEVGGFVLLLNQGSLQRLGGVLLSHQLRLEGGNFLVKLLLLGSELFLLVCNG